MKKSYFLPLLVAVLLNSCQFKRIVKREPQIVVNGELSANKEMKIHTSYGVDNVYDEFTNVEKYCINYTILNEKKEKVKIFYCGEFYIISK